MKMMDKSTGIWFFYDGECPLCTNAANAIRIKKDYGTLHLINARDGANDQLLQEINQQGFDLDEGMVIFARGQFFHGKDALKFMAQYGDPQNIFTVFCKALFWSNLISSLTYPWMRAARNWLLRRRNIKRIDNLNLKADPIFKSIFGDSWNSLPTVMHRHYANHPYTNDSVIVEGALDVMCSGPIKFMRPLMESMGQIPVRNEKAVPVTVQFQSNHNSKAFHFIRTFYFRDKSPYVFHSQMIQIKNNEVIEVMQFGLGWRMLYSWDGKKVVLKHEGYAIRLLGYFIPVPLAILIGKGYAEEIPIDDDTFDMITYITHPWWGKVYEYKGRFKVFADASNS